MNKKQRDLLKYSKEWEDNDNRIIPRAVFSQQTVKWYVLALILLFHIMPLLLLACGKTGIQIMDNLLSVYLNPMIVFAVMLIYGVREGWSLKMCLIATILSSISMLMYYSSEFDPEKGLLYYPLVSFSLAFFAYGIMGFIGDLLGAFIKHLGIFR